MKKLLVLLALCMVLAVMFVACNDEPEPPVDETTAGSTEAPTTEGTTEAPTTETQDPTTEETTEAPTTETQAPTTEETTEVPTTETQAPTTETTTEEETTTEAPDPADPVFFAGAADLAGVATAGAGIAGAEVVTEDGFEFVRITVNSGDPQFTVGSNIGVVPQYLAFVYRTTAELDAEMFIGTSNGPNGTNDHVVLDWNNDGNWHILVVDLANCSSTNITDGNVGYFRLDPFRGATEGALDLAYIGFYNTAKYATDAFFANIATIVPSADMASSIPGSPDIVSAEMSADGTYITITTSNINGDPHHDPFYQLPMLNGKGVVANYVAIKYRTSTEGARSEIFVGSGAGPAGGTDNYAFDLVTDGKWHLIVIDLANTPAVVDGVVNFLRWDPYVGNTETAVIDMAYIGLFASEADALAYDATLADVYVNTLNVPQENWTVSGHAPGLTDTTSTDKGGMITAAGVEHAALLHQGAIYVGELNLAEFSKVVVFYGLDGSDITIGHYNNATANRIILSKVDTNGTNSPAEEDIIASATYVDLGWNLKALVIDLSEVDYEGPVYVTYDTLPGTFMLINEITFTYDPNYVEPEEEIETIYYDGTNGDVTVPAGETVKFFIRNAVGMNLIVTNANGLTVVANDMAGTVAPLEVVEGTVTQFVPDGWFTIELTLTNTTDADIAASLTFEDPNAGNDEPAGNALAVGENVVSVAVSGYYCPGVEMTFTAEEAGTYAFSFTDDADEGELYYYADPINGMVEELPLALDLEAGQTITVIVATANIFMAEGGEGTVDVDVFVARI